MKTTVCVARPENIYFTDILFFNAITFGKFLFLSANLANSANLIEAKEISGGKRGANQVQTPFLFSVGVAIGGGRRAGDFGGWSGYRTLTL